MESCPIQFLPKYYRRYVDDSFFTLEHKDHVKKFLRHMNSRHRNIQFTFDEQSNEKILFLDIFITKSDNKLVTSSHRKKVCSGAYLNCNSFLPTNCRKGLIDTLLFRPYSICADISISHNEIKY